MYVLWMNNSFLNINKFRKFQPVNYVQFSKVNKTNKEEVSACPAGLHKK